MSAAPHKVRAQFVDVNGRRVMVRYAGEGPAVILLHQSPQNSRALLPWIERLSANYAVFAPDTPGFGYSDPLPLLQPTIPDFAAAIGALIDRLGIEKVLIYGVHTGAVTALRFALDFPDRVAGLVCDGYARFDADERQQLLNGYLPPFEPSWDGGHLLWLWARLREQNLFFPWNSQTKASRMAYPAPSTEKLAADSLDLLDAGDGYRAGYRAPFLYDDATAAARLKVQGRIYYRKEDVLAPHLTRLQNLPASIEAEIVHGGPAALIEKTDAFFVARAGDASKVNAIDVVANAISPRRRMFDEAGLPLAALTSTNGGALTSAVVAVHLGDIGVPARIPVDIPHGTPVIAFELPGHGASRPWPMDQLSLDAIAASMLHAIHAMGVIRFAVTAEGGSGALGAALTGAAAAARGATCERLTLINPLPLSPEERGHFLSQLPDLTPHSSGAHLIAAWNWARMKHLFWPWQPQSGAYARKVDAPAPIRLQTELVEIVRAANELKALWSQCLEARLEETLANAVAPVEIVVDDEPERVRLGASLAASMGLNVKTQTELATKNGVVKWHK